MGLGTAKNIALGVLGAAVIGLGAVVAVDHTAGASPVPAAAHSAALTSRSSASQSGFDLLAERSGGPMRILQWLSTETGVPPLQIIADVRAGETLNQIADSKATKLHDDLLTYVRKALDKTEAKGAITSADETRLLNDAGDAISVLMNAKLGLLFAGH